MARFKFGWWTTGRDKAAVNLFETVARAVEGGKISGDFSYVFISRRKGEGEFSDEIARMAMDMGIPVVMFSAVEFEPELRREDRDRWRSLYHKELYERIKVHGCPLAVLAGYMWVLSPEICNQLLAINLHPALPGGPTGTWQEVIWKLIEQKADKTGAMMHVVTPELDRGPAITYFSFPIQGPDWQELWDEYYTLADKYGVKGVVEEVGEELPLFKSIRHQGEIRELPLIVQTLKALADGRILLKKGQLYLQDGQPLEAPLDLSPQVDEEIKKLVC